MLFDVAVVSQAEFDKQMQDLRQKGQVGQLSMDLSRQGQPSTDLGITGESGGSN